MFHRGLKNWNGKIGSAYLCGNKCGFLYGVGGLCIGNNVGFWEQGNLWMIKIYDWEQKTPTRKVRKEDSLESCNPFSVIKCCEKKEKKKKKKHKFIVGE